MQSSKSRVFTTLITLYEYTEKNYKMDKCFWHPKKETNQQKCDSGAHRLFIQLILERMCMWVYISTMIKPNTKLMYTHISTESYANDVLASEWIKSFQNHMYSWLFSVIVNAKMCLVYYDGLLTWNIVGNLKTVHQNKQISHHHMTVESTICYHRTNNDTNEDMHTIYFIYT